MVGSAVCDEVRISRLDNAAVRRSVWRGIHFNEHLPVGADRVWARQVVLASYTVTYAPDAVVYDPPEQIHAAGMESIRRMYGEAFAQAPSAQATISHRLIQGSFVVDQESVSGLPGGRSASAVVIYEVRDGKIRRVWILR